MTTYAGGCTVSVTLTPTPSGAMTFVAGATVGLYVSPTPGGAHLTTYEDPNGQLKPIELREWYKGRRVKQSGTTLSYTRVFHIVGTFETTDCLDIGPQIGDLDDVLPTFVVQSRDLQMYAKGGGGVKMTEMDIVELTVDYQQPVEPQSSGGDAEATYAYEFTSESEHVDLAISQTHYGIAPEAGQDLLINFDGQQVEGLEIDSPVVEFTEEHVFTEAQFTPSFRSNLASNVKKVNSAVWREFEIGSVLFDGASASKRGKRWYVSFRFRVRKGFVAQPFTIANAQGGLQAAAVTKLGWQYIWFEMTKQPLAGNTKVQIAPTAIHVATVYAQLDFSVLGIGTQPLN
jgi:hypothetical protein